MDKESILRAHKNKQVVYTYSFCSKYNLEEKWHILSVSLDNNRVLVNLQNLSDPKYKEICVNANSIGESKEEAFLLGTKLYLKEKQNQIEFVLKRSNGYLSKTFQDKLQNIITTIEDF